MNNDWFSWFLFGFCTGAAVMVVAGVWAIQVRQDRINKRMRR